MLRRLVESPEFVNLVLEKAGESGSATGPVEPRITRKLARTVVDSGGKLNWFLEKVSKTPRKVNPDSLALMQVSHNTQHVLYAKAGLKVTVSDVRK